MLSLETQLGPKPIVGLRAEGGEEDELDQLFSDSSTEEAPDFSLLSQHTTVLPLSIHSITKLRIVKGYEEINKPITTLVSTLENYNNPEPYTGPFDFIPERAVPQELIIEVNEYLTGKNKEKLSLYLSKIDLDSLNDSFIVQILILKYLVDDTTPLVSYVDSEIDSRVSSLFNWILALKQDEPKCSIAFCLNAAVDYVKSSTVAPISVFFPDFTLPNILFKLCHLLYELFPSHILVPSALHNLGQFSIDPAKIEDLINEISDIQTSDNDSDFDNDFLEELAELRKGTSAVTITLQNDKITDALNLSLAAPSCEIVAMLDPPATFTYQLLDGSDKMRSDEFNEWMLNHSLIPNRPLFITPNEVSQEVQKASSLPILHVTLAKNEEKDETINLVDILEKLITRKIMTVDAISLIENRVFDPSQYGLLLPILHIINISATKPFSQGIMTPFIINNEYKAHKALEKSDKDNFERTVELYLKKIPRDLPTATIEPLNPKRPQPDILSPITKNLNLIMSLIDIHLMLDSRSPLTLLSYPFVVPPMNKDHPAMNKEWRYHALYQLYIAEEYPPYISFRAAFAIAISLVDFYPMFTSRLLFEGIYTLLAPFPVLRSSIWCMNAFFVLGLALENTGKYMFCALAHDNALPLSDIDPTIASTAGQVAQRNSDPIRAVFYYLQALQIFLHQDKINEALYVSQVLASIYQENVQYIEGIKLLNSILSDTYHLSIRLTPKQEMYWTLKPMRPSSLQHSKPKPESINSVITASTLCQFLIKMNQFSNALNVIDNVTKLSPNDTVKRVSAYLKTKIHYASGNITEMMKSIRKDSISPLIKHQSSCTKFGRFAILSFDTPMATIKLITKAYLEHYNGFSALFWSEMVCHSSIRAAASLNEIASSFHYRANALSIIWIYSYALPEKFTIKDPHKSKIMQHIGHYIDPEKLYTKKNIFTEALSTYILARACYERNGNQPKLLDCSIQIAELMISYFYLPKLYGKSSPRSVKVMKVKLITMQFKSETEMPDIYYPEQEYNSQNYQDELQSIVNNVTRISESLMDPIYIIKVQILQGILNIIKDNKSTAQKYFEFALSNIRKYYFDGVRFILKDLPLRHLNRILVAINMLLILLLSFDEKFIQQNNIVFDLLNVIRIVTRNQTKLSLKEPSIKVGEQTKRQPSLIELNNVSIPDFLPILRERKYIGQRKPKPVMDIEWQIFTILKRIRITARDFVNGKCTEKRMTSKNTNYCRQLEKLLSEERKRTRRPNIPAQPPTHHLNNFIYVFRVFDHLFTYIPSIGRHKWTQIKASKQHINLNFQKLSFSFGSSLINNELMELITKLLFTPTRSENATDTDFSQLPSLCVSLSRVIFDEEMINYIKAAKFQVINDDILFGRKKIFGNSMKGCLSTLSVGQQAVTVFADCEFQFIPFEMMFPDVCVIRSQGFYQTLSRSQAIDLPDKVIAFRSASANAVKRSEELIENVCTYAGGYLKSKPNYVWGRMRVAPIALPLYNPKKDMTYYSKKYKFCEFIETQKDVELELSALNCIPLFIFTYTDLCEWPPFIDNIVSNKKSACLFFVPSEFIKPAFKCMKNIFHRHMKRQKYFEENRNAPGKESNAIVFESPRQYVGTIRETLMKVLSVPISMIVMNK